MADLFDYLDWYGDFDLGTIPFNEVDNLILAQASYLPLAGVVPPLGERGSVSVAEAARRYAELHPAESPADLGPLLSPRTNDLLARMASTGQRFSQVRMRDYDELLDTATHEQFGAVTFDLPDGSSYVSYRGTDSSLEGWMEDCEISYRIIPSQAHALAYLHAAGVGSRRPLRVGGHSKGGNLAAYAASRLSPEERASLMEVWCNDSPGFCNDVVPLDTLRPICDRTRLYTPEYSVVGSLFDHVLAPTIIKSAGAGVMEHSAVEWQVMRGQFVRGEALRDGSERVNVAFNQLINSRDLPGRKKLLDDLYEGLTSQGIHTIGDMMSGDMAGLNATMSSINSLSPEDRQTMANFLWGIAGGTIGGAVAEAVAPVAKQLSEALADAAEAMQVRMRENASKALTRRQEAGEKVLTRRRGDEGEE